MIRSAYSALAVIGLVLALAVGGAAAGEIKRPDRQHQVYFPNTPDELNVYRVRGARDGKTIMIIGGIQGDEPGGFLSADLYADISLAKGDLIVVPRANYYSIILNHRGPDGDMNRQFADPVTAKRHKKIVSILKKLIAESDMLLNLHDGSGFYRPRWEGPQANPRRYGQSLIADTDVYHTAGGKKIELKSMALKVLAKVNPQIKNPRYRLLFNNHRTSRADSIHKEQRRSATYYALTKAGIPAFGVETSKSLPSLEMKVRHHALVVNAFMDLLGIIPATTGAEITPPKLRFVVLSVNQRPPLVLGAGETLTVASGDAIKVLHIEANYERGLSCDLLGIGSVNDLRQSLVVKRATSLVLRKDGVRIGQVKVKVNGKPQAKTGALAMPAGRMQFLIGVPGGKRMLAPGESLTITRGDKISVLEVLCDPKARKGLKVNFKGFVPKNQANNRGEDRGFVIDTRRDLIKRFSECPPGTAKGIECYRVLAKNGNRKLGQITVRVVPAKLDYLILGLGGNKLICHQGETLRLKAGEKATVLQLKTNLHKPGTGLKLALHNANKKITLPGRSIDADTAAPLAKGHPLRLVVLKDGNPIGHVRLTIGE